MATIEEEIEERTLTSSVPPLTLRPIAENAIKHGIEPKSEPSLLRSVARLTKDETVELIVENDGVGFVEANESSGFGIGMQSVRDRLENVYPRESSLTVSHLEEGGTAVRIEIPKEEKGES